VIIVEHLSRHGRGFLADRPHDEYLPRDIGAALCASVASTSVAGGARRTLYDSMEASPMGVEWGPEGEVDQCSLI
jgi:hypothetical protein